MQTYTPQFTAQLLNSWLYCFIVIEAEVTTDVYTVFYWTFHTQPHIVETREDPQITQLYIEMHFKKEIAVMKHTNK